MKKHKEEELYQGMSLRHERVENKRLSKIPVFHLASEYEDAVQVGYGIEEEGLPYELLDTSLPKEDALDDIKRTGLGVAIAVSSEAIEIYTRIYKSDLPLLKYSKGESNLENEKLRNIGKNGARIIKRKPFVGRVVEK